MFFPFFIVLSQALFGFLLLQHLNLVLNTGHVFIRVLGGAGRGKGKILNGHIFVNTHQNCTKCSVVVYGVDIELISKFQLICIIYTMISQNSMLTKLSWTNFVSENYMRYSYTIFSNCSLYSIGRNKYFGFLFKLLDTFLLHA